MNLQGTEQKLEIQKKDELILQDCQLHKYHLGKKTLLQQGNMRVSKNNGRIMLSMKVLSEIVNYPMAVHEFTNSKSYILRGFNAQLYSYSFSKITQGTASKKNLEKFEAMLIQNDLFIDINNNITCDEIISKNYPNLKKEELYHLQNENKTGFWNSTKGFFKKKGQSIGNGFNKAFNYLNNAIWETHQQRLAALKQKSQNWNKKNHTIWKPVAIKTNQIITKVNTSQNKALKLVRSMSVGTESFLNNVTGTNRLQKAHQSQLVQKQVRSELPNVQKGTQEQCQVKSEPQ